LFILKGFTVKRSGKQNLQSPNGPKCQPGGPRYGLKIKIWAIFLFTGVKTILFEKTIADAL
jgi:hypothetical protein